MVDTWQIPKEESTTKPTGLMLPEPSESEIKASELLGDTEYELYFRELLDKSPLFKLGFDPKHIYYQREPLYPGKLTSTAGTYYNKSNPNYDGLSFFQKKIADTDVGEISKNKYKEIIKAIQNKEIPEEDFLFMSSFMLPGDRSIEVYPGFDAKSEQSFHMHEFMHRALDTVPELKEWKTNTFGKNTSFGKKLLYEEILMGAFVSKYFPELSEFENKRIKGNYHVDLNKNKKKLDEWINEVENIANNILENKGVKVIKPKIKPKPKPKSIMAKEKIIPKIKPKQEKKQRTWMEIIKGLFK